MMWLAISLGAASYLNLTEELLQDAETKYGKAARNRLIHWDKLIPDLKHLSEMQKLIKVNQFFNRVRFLSDDLHWGQNDYWATPIEFIASNGGDCEDFSIAKYFTLRELGIPEERLYLTYVKAIELNQAHMVLTYYTSPSSEPLVLDNLINEIKKASKRQDLLPVYSFNAEGLWLAKAQKRGKHVGSSDQLSSWVEFKKRLQRYDIGQSLN